jgi:hypothetical protein
MRAELLAGLLLAAAPCGARTRVPKNIPTADALLAGMSAAPSAGGIARGRVQFFRAGGKPKGLGTTIYALPNGRLRREIRDKGPRKPAVMILIDDGRGRSVYLPKLNRLWTGSFARETAAQEAERLKSLYEVAVTTGGRVAKQRTWRLNFSAPGGRVRRSFWVDRDSGLLLKTETYRYDGTLARRDRLLKLETPAQVDASLFAADSFAGAETRPLAPPDPIAPGTRARFPRWTPPGFLLLESRSQDAGALARYGDGAASFTVFEGPAGASSGLDEKAGRAARLADGSEVRLLPAGEGAALVRRSAAGLLVVAGDLADEELARVAESVGAGR